MRHESGGEIYLDSVGQPKLTDESGLNLTENILPQEILPLLNEEGIVVLQDLPEGKTSNNLFSFFKKNTFNKLRHYAIPAALGISAVLYGCGDKKEGGNVEFVTRPAGQIIEVPKETPTNVDIPSTPTTEKPPIDVENTPPPRPTEQPTEVPTIESKTKLGNGKYNSIEEMPITEVQKRAMEKLLANSEVQIITDNLVIAIEKELMTRTKAINPSSPANLTEASSLTKVTLDTQQFPDALERLEEATILFKYHQFINKTKRKEITFEDYKSGTENYVSTIRAYEGISDISTVGDDHALQRTYLKEMVITKNTPIVVIMTAQDTGDFIEVGSANGLSITSLDGVIGIFHYQFDPGGIGNTDPNFGNPSEFRFTAATSFMFGVLSDPDISNAGSKTSTYQPDLNGNAFRDVATPVIRAIFDIMAPVKVSVPNNPSIIAGIGIFDVEGKAAEKK